MASTLFNGASRRTQWASVVLALCAGVGCSDGGRAIVEDFPNRHARVQGTVLLDGAPRAGVDVANNPPAFAGLFGGHAITDAEGHFDLYLLREAAPSDPATMSMTIVAFARPPVVASRLEDSARVSVTFTPLADAAAVLTLTEPIALQSVGAPVAIRLGSRRRVK